MILFVVRHAKAFERDSREWPDDSLRPLTKGGIRKFEALALRVRELYDPPELVYASGFARAWETAEILRREAQWAKPIRCSALECDHDRGVEMTRVLLSLRTEKTIAIVGHEPMLSDLVGDLLGSAGPAILMSKGAIAVLELSDWTLMASGNSHPGASATLLALVDPKWVA